MAKFRGAAAIVFLRMRRFLSHNSVAFVVLQCFPAAMLATLLALSFAAAVLGDPPFNAGLFTTHRPPQQPATAKSVMKTNTQSASKQSGDQEKAVIQLLKDSRDKLDSAHPYYKNNSVTDDELLKWFQWEFERLPIIHNGPIYDRVDGQYPLDDTDVFTTMKNGYIQNIIQRWTLGREGSKDFTGQSGIMQNYLNYPNFKNAQKPTLREANTRPIYSANNLDKKHCGNYEYGKVTYVINPLYVDKYYFLPFDSGSYAKTEKADYCNSGICMGTVTPGCSASGTCAINHVVRQHYDTYSSYKATTLAPIFNRWYNPVNYNATPISELKYFEVELSMNAWLPEALLYATVKYW
jgi:hypothetical protein